MGVNHYIGGVSRYFSPLDAVVSGGAGVDDGVTLTTAFADGAGGEPVLALGSFTTTSPIAVPSNTAATFGPGSSISAMPTSNVPPPGFGFNDAVFYSPLTRSLATTLAANVVAGQDVAQVLDVTNLPVGGRLVFYRGDDGSSYAQIGIGITGSADITAGALYGGGGTLNGQTIILDTGGGPQTLNLSGTGNAANEAALLAAILAKWPALTHAVQGGASGKALVLTAPSLTIGAGTANGALGISSTLNTIQTDIPIWGSYQVADAVYNSVPTTNVHLDLGGAVIHALGGTRTTWFDYSEDFVVENATFLVNSTSYGPNYDEGSRRCVFRNIVAKNVGSCTSGFTIEGGGQDDILDRCSALGPFVVGFQISGFRHSIRDCISAGSTTYGIALRHGGGADIFATQNSAVEGGRFEHSQYGIGIISNSSKNTITGANAADNAAAGFVVATGVATAVTTGASNNTFVSCVSERDAVGFLAGDGSSGADGNTFVSCTSLSATSTAFLVQGDATGTAWTNCVAQGSAGVGFGASGPVTMVGCRSKNSTGRGLHVGGSAPSIYNVYVSDYMSTGDGAGLEAVRVENNGRLVLDVASITPGAGAGGIYYLASGDLDLRNVDIAMTSTGAQGIILSGSGTARLRDVRVTGGGNADGNLGITITSGTVEFGPGCNFSNIQIPVTLAGGTVTMVQGGVPPATPTLVSGGNVNLSFKQNYATAIECTGALTGAATVTPLAIPGLEFTFRNNTTGGQTVGLKLTSTVNVAAGKSARIRVNGSGDVERVTADT